MVDRFPGRPQIVNFPKTETHQKHNFKSHQAPYVDIHLDALWFTPLQRKSWHTEVPPELLIRLLPGVGSSWSLRQEQVSKVLLARGANHYWPSVTDASCWIVMLQEALFAHVRI